ncbi:hypothetical protein ABBQ32_004322 [Trebouxia sp. C0010 RCD-2024]
MHEFFGLGSTHFTEVDPHTGLKESIKLRVHSLLIKLQDDKACIQWKEFMRDEKWLPEDEVGWPVFKDDVDLDVSSLQPMPTRPITALSPKAGEQAANQRDKDRLDNQRQSIVDAIELWQEWLEHQHQIWDDHEELTFNLPPPQKTMPTAKYKQSVPIPPGMSVAETETARTISSASSSHGSKPEATLTGSNSKRLRLSKSSTLNEET